MLYKIDYTERNEKTTGTKWVNFAANRTEGVTRFMDWFMQTHPANAVRVDLVTEVNIIGDMSGIDAIDASLTP